MRNFSFDVHIFREGDTYAAYVPPLDVSSCGATDEDARRNIRDAGYRPGGDIWRAPEFVSLDRLTMSIV